MSFYYIIKKGEKFRKAVNYLKMIKKKDYCEENYILGCSESLCRFLVDGVRTDLNISERLKTNDMRIYRKRRYFRHTWKKICDTLIFVSFIRL